MVRNTTYSWNTLRTWDVERTTIVQRRCGNDRRSVTWQNSLVFSGVLCTKLTLAQNF